MADACRRVAARAARNVYTAPPAVDVTVLDTAHFDFMQHGLNHVAAFAAREGVTSMGDRYKLPKPPPGHLPETRRREAMERATYARDHLLFLEESVQRAISRPEIFCNWARFLGRDAQGALEHALKAVIAAHGRLYVRIHNLQDLLQAVRTCVPDLALHSDLAKLSRFAGGDVCGNPELDIEPDQMLIHVRNDVAQMSNSCAHEAGFDPWTCRKTDYQRGA